MTANIVLKKNNWYKKDREKGWGKGGGKIKHSKNSKNAFPADFLYACEVGFGVRIGGKNIFKILQKHVKNVQNSYKITILGLKNAKNTTNASRQQTSTKR